MATRLHTRRIVFHHSESPDVSAGTIRRWHTTPKKYGGRGWQDIGYHYVIRASGDVEPGREVNEIGSHAYGKNRDSIGVCLTGDFRKHEPTQYQLQAALDLYARLCQRYYRTLKIEFHRPAWHAHACPGKRLDRSDFLEIVSRGDPFGS